MVYEILGAEHLELLKAVARWGSNINVLQFERNFPASQHYHIDDNVDPRFIAGLEALRKHFK